jgi:hypothetical protein
MRHVLGAVVDPIRMLSVQSLTSRQHYKHGSSYFWAHGYPLETTEYSQVLPTTRKDAVGRMDAHLSGTE